MPNILPAQVIPLPLAGISASRQEIARPDEALRRGARDGRVGAFLPRLARYLGENDQAQGEDKTAERADGAPGRGQGGPAGTAGARDDQGDSAPFLAQVLAQGTDTPAETAIDPFGEATQAYARRAGPETSVVVDTPVRVDFNV